MTRNNYMHHDPRPSSLLSQRACARQPSAAAEEKKKTHPRPLPYGPLLFASDSKQLKPPLPPSPPEPSARNDGKERSPKGHAGARDGGSGTEGSGTSKLIRTQGARGIIFLFLFSRLWLLLPLHTFQSP